LNNFITITTDRLLLRKLEISDRDDFFRNRSLPEIYEYQSFMPKNVAEVDDCIYAILKEE
jgi:RimJ/RimL family protein N-acetyltransferase